MDNSIITFFDVMGYLMSKGITPTTEGPNTTPGWINIDCPWCGDKMKHLGINLENNGMSCWRCGGHNIGKLVQLLENCSWSEAMEIMEKYQNFNRPEKLEKTLVPAGKVEIPKEFRQNPLNETMIIAEMIPAYKFLESRGFLGCITKMLRKYELYYSGWWGIKYKFRILFPIYIHHQLVTFMTRDVTGKAKEPYISQPPNEAVIPCKHTLYGYDEVSPGATVVLVEGPIDQWKLGTGSLATWGTGWTMEQIALLRSLYPKKVYILFDSEEVAQEQAKKLGKAIWYCDSEVLYLDDHKDPGELTIQEGKEVMRELTK